MGIVRGQNFTDEEHIHCAALEMYLSQQGFTLKEAITFLRKVVLDLERVQMEKEANNN